MVMVISVLVSFSSPSFDTLVSSRWRFLLVASSSEGLFDSLLEDVEVADADGLTLEPREREVEGSLAISFEGVDEREVASSFVVSLKVSITLFYIFFIYLMSQLTFSCYWILMISCCFLQSFRTSSGSPSEADNWLRCI